MNSRLLAGLSALLLILLGLLWELWLAPLRPGGSWLAVKILPLLPIALRLLGPYPVQRQYYSAKVSTLLVWVYVTEGLVRATSETGLNQTLALIELALCAALFGFAVHFIREQRKLKAQDAIG